MKKNGFLFIMFLLIMVNGCGAPKEYKAGEKAFNNQDYEKAIFHFREFIEKYPEDSLVRVAKEKISLSYYKLGLEFERSGDDTTALQMFKSAIGYDPNNNLLKDKLTSVYIRKGKILLNSGYYETALNYLQEAIPYETETALLANFIADANFLQGYNHLKAQQQITAKRYLQKAINTMISADKKSKYEKILVTEANEYLRNEDFFQAYLYFLTLKEIYNNSEYQNLADYNFAQMEPQIGQYSSGNPIHNPLDQLALDITEGGIIYGFVKNTSNQGFLTYVNVTIQIFEHGESNQSMIDLNNVNLLEGYIGFLSSQEINATRTLLPLEPLGVRKFAIKTKEPIQPSDIVEIKLNTYQFETERKFEN